MYEHFYSFRDEPFRLSPDHQFAYEHKAYAKARAYLTYAFMRAEGFVMITGRPGTGKTTLIMSLLEHLDTRAVTAAHLVCTQLQGDELLKVVAYEFGVPPTVVNKGELLDRLGRQLKCWQKEGRRALLIVDEAQDLSLSAMEELRLLTNIQQNSRPLLQIFLLGQPQLKALILRPELEQVHQRIIAAEHMVALSPDDTSAYIRHRLETVGWRGDPAISEAIYPLIHRCSEGVPRRINLICSRLLLHCAVEERHKVSVEDLRQVLEELQGEELAAGVRLQKADFDVEDSYPPAPLDREGSGGEQSHRADNSAAGASCPGTGDERRQREALAMPRLKVIGGQAAVLPKAATPGTTSAKLGVSGTPLTGDAVAQNAGAGTAHDAGRQRTGGANTGQPESWQTRRGSPARQPALRRHQPVTTYNRSASKSADRFSPGSPAGRSRSTTAKPGSAADWKRTGLPVFLFLLSVLVVFVIAF